MKHIYVADDGKQFDDKTACLEYETAKKAEAEKKKKLVEEKEARRKTIKELAKQFYKDYGESYDADSPNDDFYKVLHTFLSR